jgi:hypothetical protein
MKKGSMRSPIPEDVREKLSNDLRMKRCSISDNECSGDIEWHHNITFQGKRLDEAWAIVSVCKFHQDHEARHDISEKLLRVSLNRASYNELSRISKEFDYIRERSRLNKYGQED